MAAAFRASAAGPDGHMMIDCGANVHFFTLEDARRYFSNYRSTSMSIVGISGTRDPCSAEGEINLSVVDSSGKHLNMRSSHTRSFQDRYY